MFEGRIEEEPSPLLSGCDTTSNQHFGSHGDQVKAKSLLVPVQTLQRAHSFLYKYSKAPPQLKHTNLLLTGFVLTWK